MSVDRAHKDAAETVRSALRDFVSSERYYGLDGAADALDVLVSELEAAQKERDELETLLRRLSEWDALTVADQWPLGDGPYWKREIARVLAAVSATPTPTKENA